MKPQGLRGLMAEIERNPTPRSIRQDAEEALREKYEELEAFNERAAIREYLGGFSREEAERLALEDVKKQKPKECR